MGVIALPYALPVIEAAAEAAAEALVYIGAAGLAYLGTIAADSVSQSDATDCAASQTSDGSTTGCPQQRQPCPECTPPVGTRGYQIHLTHSHYPCPGAHIHWFRRMQNPNNCQCFWYKGSEPTYCLSPGESPPILPTDYLVSGA